MHKRWVRWVTAAHQIPLSMGFPRHVYWVARDLPNPGIKPTSPELVDRLFTTEPPGKPMVNSIYYIFQIC